MVHKKLKIVIGTVLVLALGAGAFVIHQQANERETANVNKLVILSCNQVKHLALVRKLPLRKQKKALALAWIQRNLRQTK